MVTMQIGPENMQLNLSTLSCHEMKRTTFFSEKQKKNTQMSIFSLWSPGSEETHCVLV